MMGKVLYKLDLLEVDFPLRCDLLFEDVGLFFLKMWIINQFNPMVFLH